VPGGSPGLARFNEFELDLRAGELRQNGGETVRLGEQPFQILVALLERSGEVVLREELRKRLWPNDTIVEFEHSINAAMNRLRQALGDSADKPRYIETLARRGYRWMVPVEWVEIASKKAQAAPAATAETPRTHESLIGKRVSHYRILEILGGGGMGIVYKAEDLRLGRRVAIKFLGEELATDHRALERFEHEARAISAVEQANICTIYEVEEHEGQPFIVMQLLPGQTLRQRIESADPAKATFSQSELLDFGIQIATGLEAAHQKGVIHRDIKPANIFITNRGEIKLLDFGLAKLTDAGLSADSPIALQHESGPSDSRFAATSKSSITLTGALMGTASYMSPEQVRREQVDARSDLFSFGVVLYEMATGHQPFCGDDLQAIHDAILNYTPPPPLTWNPKLPAQFESIISKMLEKDREKRYQSASEIASDLKGLKRDLESDRVGQSLTAADHDGTPSEATAAGVITAQPARSFARRRYFFFAALAVLLLTVYAAYRYRPSKPRRGLPKVTLISHWNKPMNGARLSPDGRVVAFSSPVGIVDQIFVMLTSGGEPLQLTHDDGDKYVDSFSADGTEIYYESAVGPDQEWAVPTLGGTPRRVASGCCLKSSPDGNSLFYLKSHSTALFRAERSGANEERVYSFDSPPLLPLSLLPYPNGTDLLVAGRAHIGDEHVHLYKVNVAAGTAASLGTLSGLGDDMVWAEPGKTVLLTRTVEGLTNLWQYSLVDGQLTQLTSDPGPDLSPMPDRTAGIYFVNGKFLGRLSVYHDRSKDLVEIEPENGSQPIISPDGKRVVYIKYVAPGKDELWVSNLDRTNKMKLAASAALLTGEWARDSSRISYFDNARGGGRAYVVRADGRDLRGIGTFKEPIDWIAWSADGKSLYVTTWKNKSERALWKASSDGSSFEKFLDNACTVMDASADGRYLLGSLIWGDGAGIYQISLSDKKLDLLLPGIDTRPLGSRLTASPSCSPNSHARA
jgi:serine/threonine protein kinase/Tol biopolymer transport system component